MKKNHRQNVNLIEDGKPGDKNRSIFRSFSKKINLTIFAFLLITMTNVMTRGQRADEFNPNVTHSSSNPTVTVIQMQPDGKFLIGGRFTNVGGQARNNLARVNADGMLDATFVNTNLNLDNAVRSIILQSDGKIIVATVGVSLQAQALNQLFRFNADGTPDTTFNPNVDKGVYGAVLQNDGKIIIGGFFATVGGQAKSNLARLNADGTLDTSFTLTSDSTVGDVARQADGKILIGGIFSNIGGLARSRLARLNADGTLDMSFNFQATYNSGGGVQDIQLQPDGKIIIGGYPSSDGSIKTVARLNADGTPDTAFNQNVLSFSQSFQNIRTVAVQANGKILLGGSFISPQPSLIRLNADGTTDFAFNPRPSAPLSVSSIDALLVQPDQKILVGGYFTTIGGANRNSLARLFSDSLPLPVSNFDFDGDNKADISFFRPSNGTWHINQSASGSRTVQFGVASDRLAPADYDGDFKTDIAVFREGAAAYFYILKSSTNTFREEPFGTTGDVPIPGDFDGDSKADVAVYRNGASGGAQSYFYYRPTATTGVDFRQIAWGAADDKPVVGDYDADGKQDIAVFRPSNGVWYVLRSSDNQLQAAQFGIATDKLVAADYDGDGKTDYAVFRDGIWYLQRSQLGFTAITFGAATDLPVPADYDGDSKTDIGVFRNGTWYLNRSTAGPLGGAYSAATDRPVPSAFVQ